eukprot:2567717-Lingulodinium_polyedra.AAC.1
MESLVVELVVEPVGLRGDGRPPLNERQLARRVHVVLAGPGAEADIGAVRCEGAQPRAGAAARDRVLGGRPPWSCSRGRTGAGASPRRT